ncbi:hypothetical protein A2W70_03175 [Candidatus Curtissbacteria bacterium RIFCSPLOWO2_02_41_11]|uniref:Uncharacterized protein n=2 Tax=Candidatus Curtissiibacteriota TaxID=1752717 RepID=A0A1F5HTG6_9BACT|nr:MAG: hypothetical protein UU56_C0008G0080 [Candidatus Curtissbacteria bacterium GW2011_GWA2_41_24]OGE07366.1 MAG: hypothetical protein A2W70_03175 [Candidatus Curtissbacteria bacterium RIFCSPLOWO2_02_41_11]
MSDTATDLKSQADGDSTAAQPVQPPDDKMGAVKAKEQEPTSQETKAEEGKILSEVIRTSEAADEQAEKAIQSAISEARLARPEPKLAPDVADSGVKVPQEQADEVVRSGTTINLPISEDEYKKGLHQKVAGTIVNKVVVGTSSFFALATWVGRLIKMTHKHAMKVIFKKGVD